MRTLKCKCGDKTMWATGGVHDCEGCEDCQTTYADSPDNHKPLQPHDWGVRYNVNTGNEYKVCKICFHVDEESYQASKVINKK